MKALVPDYTTGKLRFTEKTINKAKNGLFVSKDGNLYHEFEITIIEKENKEPTFLESMMFLFFFGAIGFGLIYLFCIWLDYLSK